MNVAAWLWNEIRQNWEPNPAHPDPASEPVPDLPPAAPAAPPPDAAHAARLSKIAEIEDWAERFLGAKALVLKRLAAELRELL